MRLTKSQIVAEINLAREAFARGDISVANQRLASVLRSNPDSVDGLAAKALMLIGQNRQAEALPVLELALKHDPSNSDLLALAALTSLTLWQGDRAEQFAKRLTKFYPTNDRGYFMLSNALTIQGHLEDALNTLERSLAILPNEPDYVIAKAQLLGRLKWSSQAIEWYEKALKLHPMPELSIELAEALIEEGQARESLTELEKVIPLLPPESIPHALYAQALTELHEFDHAAAYWAKAKASSIDPVELVYKHANSEIFAGRLDVAEELLRQALDENPYAAPLYRPFTSIKNLSSADAPLIEHMEQLRREGFADPSLGRDLNYALGKAYHDLGEFRQAMDRYDEANRIAYGLSSSSQRFDPNAWRAYTDRQIEYFTKARVDSLEAHGNDSERPIFIMGMIRSGTTLTEQILSTHSNVSAGGESTFWPDHREELFDPKALTFDTAAGKRRGREFLEILRRKSSGERYVTEKNPSNVLIAPLIHCVYPKAKLVHIKRHPVDNLLSIWMTPIQTSLPFMHNRENLVFAYREYIRLFKHLTTILPGDRFRTFEYEKITSYPQVTISNMLAFLDLEPEPESFNPERNARTVRTPSFYQVRQPINTNSQERWKQFEPWLDRFQELLVEG